MSIPAPIVPALIAKFPIHIIFIISSFPFLLSSSILLFILIFIDVGVNIYIPGTVEEIDKPLVDSPKCTLTDVD